MSPLILAALSSALQAQFNYVTNGGGIAITGYTGPGGAVAIPGTLNGLPVLIVGEGVSPVFNTGVTAVTIPGTVFQISPWAFDNVSSLASVTIPGSVTSIGDSALADCTKLTSITILDSVTNIGSYAFLADRSLTNATILDGLTSQGIWAFSGCTGLTSLTMGASLTDIGYAVFVFDTGLASVCFTGNAPSADVSIFDGDNHATVYYLPGATGWGQTLASRPAVLWDAQVLPGSFGIHENQFGFNITGSSNLVVVIEASTNLTDPTWYPLQTNTLNGTLLFFTDPQWTNYANRFYRLTWP